MQISVTSDIHKAVKSLSDLKKKQVPAATKWAINNTAVLVKEAEEREIRNVFNNPTRFTQNSLWIQWARPGKLEAIVKIKDHAVKGTAASKYLAPEIEGGPRRHKGFEKLLISKGMMPANMYAVPSRTVKRDSYGNVSKGLIQKILSGLQAQRDVHQRARKGSRTSGGYFAGIIGNVHGIWDVKALHDGGPALLFIYTNTPNYTKRLNFQAVAARVISRSFNKEFGKALAYAIATAR